MTNLNIIGVLLADTKGELYLIEINKLPLSYEPGKITISPTPEEHRIGKEVKKDLSVDGILKKLKNEKEKMV